MPSFPPPGSPSSEVNSSDLDSDPKMLTVRLLLVMMCMLSCLLIVKVIRAVEVYFND